MAIKYIISLSIVLKNLTNKLNIPETIKHNKLFFNEEKYKIPG